MKSPMPMITAFRLFERESSFLVRFFENFVDSMGSGFQWRMVEYPHQYAGWNSKVQK